MRFAEINSSGETQLQKEKQKPWPTISREPGFRFLALALRLEDDLQAQLHDARPPGAVNLALAAVVDVARAIAVRTRIGSSGCACRPN